MSDPDDPTAPVGADRRLAAITGASRQVPPDRARVHRLADATRRLLHATPGTAADAATLRAAAVAVEEAADALEQFETRSMHGFGEAANSGDPHGFFDQSPMLGRSNPLAPPLILQETDGEHIEAITRFGPGYEGPPGCVHGGYIAAAFDDVLGLAQSLSGQHGMTGQLVVNYRSPTPLHEELRFVGTFDRVEGRKIFTSGTLHAGNRLCAEAEGLFISVDFERFARLRERQQRRDAERAGGAEGAD